MLDCVCALAGGFLLGILEELHALMVSHSSASRHLFLEFCMRILDLLAHTCSCLDVHDAKQSREGACSHQHDSAQGDCISEGHCNVAGLPAADARLAQTSVKGLTICKCISVHDPCEPSSDRVT